jgi:hypothetical protein
LRQSYHKEKPGLPAFPIGVDPQVKWDHPEFFRKDGNLGFPLEPISMTVNHIIDFRMEVFAD